MPPLALSSPRTDPLVVFMHIPKTAGSSINSTLRRDLGPGMSRIIHLVDRTRPLSWVTARAAWVSGHVYFPRLDAGLRKATHRPLRYVTVFRDPIANLASHYNWYIEVHRRGAATYYRYSAYQRGLSEQIRRADNSDPQQIIAILRQHRGTFLNHQARYLLGEGAIDRGTPEDLRAALRNFAYAGRSEDLSAFYAAIGARADRAHRDNSSPYDFDPAVFKTPAMLDFLNDRHALDMALTSLIAAPAASPSANTSPSVTAAP